MGHGFHGYVRHNQRVPTQPPMGRWRLDGLIDRQVSGRIADRDPTLEAVDAVTTSADFGPGEPGEMQICCGDAEWYPLVMINIAMEAMAHRNR